MVELNSGSRPRRLLVVFALVICLAVVASATPAAGQKKSIEVLKIGTSGSMTQEHDDKKKEEAAMDSLKSFIREETMLNNQITREKDWSELLDKMAKGELHIGVFHGYEFAWAQEKNPGLKPLALAVNVHRYPVVYVVVNKDKGPKDFAGLQGQAIAIPSTGQPYLQKYVDHLTQAGGKAPDKFFSKVTTQENIEDALDDVVDGMVQGAVVEQAGLEAFKRRKPGRFSRLKDIDHSPPLPPVIVAYYDKVLSDDTLKAFREGLLGASKKEKGQTLLTLFHLTGFEPVPDDFPQVLVQSRKTFPVGDRKAAATK